MINSPNSMVGGTVQSVQPPQNMTVDNVSVGMSPGWYMLGATVVSVALANTPVGPIFLGVMTVALLYQISLWLRKVPPSSNFSALA